MGCRGLDINPWSNNNATPVQQKRSRRRKGFFFQDIWMCGTILLIYFPECFVSLFGISSLVRYVYKSGLHESVPCVSNSLSQFSTLTRAKARRAEITANHKSPTNKRNKKKHRIEWEILFTFFIYSTTRNIRQQLCLFSRGFMFPLWSFWSFTFFNLSPFHLF